MALFLPIMQVRLLECVPVAAWSTTSKASFVYKLRTGKADSPLHLVLPISSVSPLCRGLASSCFQSQQTQGPFLLPSLSLPSQSVSLSGLLSPTSLQQLPPRARSSRKPHNFTSTTRQHHQTAPTCSAVAGPVCPAIRSSPPISLNSGSYLPSQTPGLASGRS